MFASRTKPFSTRPSIPLPKWVAVFLLIVLPMAIGLTAAQAKKDRPRTAAALYHQAQKSYYQLMDSKEKQAFRHRWIQSADKFLEVYKKHPTSSQAYKALFTSARLYQKLFSISRKNADRDRALHFYYKVVSEFDDARLTDDALYEQGAIHLQKKNYPLAMDFFEMIVQNYSDGDRAVRARRQMQKIRPLLKNKKQTAWLPDKGRVSPVILQGVSYSSTERATRVVVHTTGPVKITQNRLAGPERIYFNFVNSRLGDSLAQEVPVEDRIVNRVRVSQFDKNTSRLVLHINPVENLKVVTSQEDSRVVIDLQAAVPDPAPRPRLQEAKKVAKKTIPRPPKTTKKIREERPVIVVDAGHGGKDFGARSRSGLHEKDINLKISKRLKTILETRYNYRVVMTRRNDTFIPLEDRGKIANGNNADLFVSVHANAAKRRSAHGIETYYLGAGKSQQAQETAARENGDLVYSVKDDQVQQILASLISTTKMNDSAFLAGQVQKNLFGSLKKKYVKIKDLGVKEGPFFVLHDTNMPSILVEVGFLTNKQEEKRLRSQTYLGLVADSIAKGIHAFMQDRGPTI